MEVPNFIEDPAGYVAWLRDTSAIPEELAIQSWLEGRHLAFRKMILEPGQRSGSTLAQDQGQLTGDDLAYRHLAPRCGTTMAGGQLCILRGTSPRGEHGHVVLARSTKEGCLKPAVPMG